VARWTLRRRIVWTYAALTLAVCTLFAALIYVTVGEVEDRLVYRRLEAQADWFVERHRRGETVSATSDFQFFYGSNVPAAFAALPPGIHDKTHQGRDVHVLVRETSGERFVVMDEEPGFWLIERHVSIALAIGVFAALVLALVLARLTVNRVVAPLTALAGAVDEGRTDVLLSLDVRDEIGTLARAFAQHTRALEGYLMRERSFTGDVSHELRTPLTVISGAAEVLASHAEKHPELRPLAQRIARAAADATERVNALLLLARTGEQMDPVRTELAPIVRREADRSRGLLGAKPVVLNLRIEDSVHAIARPELVSILVGNLLRNACQYTDRGAITVTLAPGSLIVDDTGPGLPATVRERLFERFVHGPQIQGGRAGLGLSIVKRIAEHLHWTVKVEDRRGGGTRVLVSLPAPSSLTLPTVPA
jgi:signal transduction histidine kinase